MTRVERSTENQSGLYLTTFSMPTNLKLDSGSSDGFIEYYPWIQFVRRTLSRQVKKWYSTNISGEIL